jgi:HSP20 family protein
MAINKWTPTWDPFEEADNFFRGFPLAKQITSFVPSLDIYQDKDSVVVETPLAGVKPEEVKISIENDVLTIEGQSEKKSEVDEKNYFRREVSYGSFHRSVALPAAVNGEKARAEYDNGVLKIIIPKEERAKAKAIKVQIKKPAPLAKRSGVGPGNLKK